MQAVAEAVEPVGGSDGADAVVQADVAGYALMEFFEDGIDLAADGGISGQYGGIACGVFVMGADVESERRDLNACRGAGGNVEAVSVVFAYGVFGCVQLGGGEAVPVLYEDNVLELFFLAGLE